MEGKKGDSQAMKGENQAMDGRETKEGRQATEWLTPHLVQVLDAGLGHLEPMPYIQRLLERMEQVFRAEYATVLRFGPNRSRLRICAATGIGVQEAERSQSVPTGFGLAAAVLRAGHPVELHDVSSHTVASPILYERGVHAMLGIPLQAGQENVGVLVMGWLEPRTFAASEVKSLEDLATRLAVAVQRARRAEEAERSLHRSERQNRFLSDVLRMAGHDLKSPLTAVKLQHDLLSRDMPLERRKRSLAIARRNMARLELMLDDLLDLARMEAGSFTLNRTDVDLRELLSDLVDSHREQARRAEIRLDVALDGDLRLHGDARRLMQVVANVLGNALRYTPGGGQVRVSSWAEVGGIGIVVQDSGRGMTPEQLRDVGQAFAESRAKDAGGSGLGLHIAQSIVDEHGGTLRVTSEGVGKGTTVEVILPRDGVQSRAR